MPFSPKRQSSAGKDLSLSVNRARDRFRCSIATHTNTMHPKSFLLNHPLRLWIRNRYSSLSMPKQRVMKVTSRILSYPQNTQFLMAPGYRIHRISRGYRLYCLDRGADRSILQRESRLSSPRVLQRLEGLPYHNLKISFPSGYESCSMHR